MPSDPVPNQKRYLIFCKSTWREQEKEFWKKIENSASRADFLYRTSSGWSLYVAVKLRTTKKGIKLKNNAQIVSTISNLISKQMIVSSTLFHITAILWNHLKHQFFLTRSTHYCSVIGRHGNTDKKQTKTQYILHGNTFVSKTKLGDPIFVLIESDQQVTMKLFAKFKRIADEIQSHLKYFSCEDSRESTP